MSDRSERLPRSDTGRFVQVPVWLLHVAGIGGRELQVYLVLASHADSGTGEAWPSRRRIAEQCGVASVRTVDAAITRLVEIGALRVRRRRGADGDWTSSVYTVLRVRPAHRSDPDDRGDDDPAAVAPGVAQVSAPRGAAGEATPGAVGCTRNYTQQEPERETPSTPTEALDRALTAVLGYAPVGQAEQRRWNAAVRALAALGATPDQIETRVLAARMAGWRSAMLTPAAIARHWGRLGTDSPDRGGAVGDVSYNAFDEGAA